jgi:multisubunit Na+/H+ antiporter MnhG subunit
VLPIGLIGGGLLLALGGLAINLISPAIGIALVFLGVMITAPAVAHAEEIAEKKEHA